MDECAVIVKTIIALHKIRAEKGMTVSVNSTLKFKMSAHSHGRRQTNKQTHCTMMAGRPGCLRSEHPPRSRVPRLCVVGPL